MGAGQYFIYATAARATTLAEWSQTEAGTGDAEYVGGVGQLLLFNMKE